MRSLVLDVDGGEEEASVHVEIFEAVWKRTPDAIGWLG